MEGRWRKEEGETGKEEKKKREKGETIPSQGATKVSQITEPFPVFGTPGDLT